MESAGNTEETKKRRISIVYKSHKREFWDDVKDAYEGNNFFNIYFTNGDKLMVKIDVIESVRFLTSLDK